jgi:hypothetical protein
MDLAASFNPDVGDYVYVASDVTVDGGASNDYPCGVVVGTTDPAEATTATCLLIARQATAGVIQA